MAAYACSIPFDLDYDDAPIIYLEAFPGEDPDIVAFEIRPAYSNSNTAIKPEFKPDITFIVNGKEIPVSLNTDHCVTDKYFPYFYVAEYESKPGDKMSIEVSSEGFETIYAETTIPEYFPERKLDLRYEDYGEDTFVGIHINIDDEEDTDYAYGFQMIEETISVSPDTVYVYQRRSGGYQLSYFWDLASVSMEGIIIDMKSSSISAWDDTMFDGKSAELSVVFPYYDKSDSEIDVLTNFFAWEWVWPYYDEEGNFICDCSDKVRKKMAFYTMSKECYKYKVAQELISDNADFPSGLAPANFCYSNVENGYGAFAGLSVVETDWITREFIESIR